MIKTTLSFDRIRDAIEVDESRADDTFVPGRIQCSGLVYRSGKQGKLNMFEGCDTELAAMWKPLASVDKECFACGPENRYGLKMSFESNGKKIRSKLKIKQEFRGWSNLIHGGIISTILDETMGWTVINFTGKFMLTRSMTVTFKKPVRVGAELTVNGYIKEQSSDRKVLVVAEIHDEDGDICAFSEGDFALFSKEQFLGMSIMPEEDIEAMASAISG